MRRVSDFLADCEVFDGLARHLVLAHLSEQNNNPSVALISAEEALGRRASLFGLAARCILLRSILRLDHLSCRGLFEKRR